MKDIIIVDIDGTVANCSHRTHLIKGPTPDWDAFFEACEHDEVIESTRDMLHLLDSQYHLIYVTGRPWKIHDKTVAWMARKNVPISVLLMRENDDFRPDHEVKREILNNNLDKSRVRLVIDDRASVVKMWRQEGLVCWQVADGEF